MPDRTELLRLLVRVRRRLRLIAAAEGAVAGVVIFLLVTTMVLLAIRRVVPEMTAGEALRLWLPPGVAAALLGGVLVSALRPISLARCARVVDQAIDTGEARNGDRTRVALALAASPPGTFVDAAIRDALRVARPTPPAEAAPFRRPRGLRALGVLAGTTVLLALWPVPPVPASARRAATDGAALVPRLRVPADALGAEREAAERAREKAGALNDSELKAAAQALGELLAALDAGSLSAEETLDRLAAMQRNAERLASEKAALRRALEAVGEKLAAGRQTRPVGDALKKLDADAAYQALQNLANQAGAMKAAEREKLSDTLAQAAAAASRARDDAGKRAEESQQRRLAHPPDQAARPEEGNSPGAEREQDRELSRLERNLEDAADRCREDPAACEQELRRAAADTPPAAREAQKSSPRRDLAEAIDQLRQRMSREGRRGPSGGGQHTQAGTAGDEPEAGQTGPPGEGRQGGRDGKSDQDGKNGQNGKEGQDGQSQRSMERRFERAARAAGGTSGAGHETGSAEAGASARAAAVGADQAGGEAGGDPLGKRGSLSSRGHVVDAKVASGAGPTRSQVIESSATEGFSRKSYRGVFEDYGAAVEETLDATAVPAGRRYQVRRYFQLIRPR